ncbi:hypothetical protein CEV33_2962 [Brucella grignonensis]|uniref:Uncharacterized protein n=1 Tax=Brucella grignonensis TaxID=94627 RepID=A0A256F376_9HYPH|nr:hypothetical protein CEV33_2962 [Brucella grignonensis]
MQVGRENSNIGPCGRSSFPTSEQFSKRQSAIFIFTGSRQGRRVGSDGSGALLADHGIRS